MTFGAGEQALSNWMSENTFVCWLEHPTPREIESRLIRELRQPLNLAQLPSFVLSALADQKSGESLRPALLR